MEQGARSVAGRIFAVLDAFDTTPAASLRLTAIARRTGLPLPTALRLVRELVAWGGLERQADGSYRVGRRLWALGGAAPCVRGLRRAASPVLHDLAAATGRDVGIAVVDGTDALVLDGVGACADGDRLPLHADALGKMLLAHAPGTVLDAVLDGGLPRLTPHTVGSPGLLAGQLRRARQTGISTAFEEVRLGHASVGAPITDRTGTVVAALGLTAPTRTPVARYAGAVTRAAVEASRNLARTLRDPADFH